MSANSSRKKYVTHRTFIHACLRKIALVSDLLSHQNQQNKEKNTNKTRKKLRQNFQINAPVHTRIPELLHSGREPRPLTLSGLGTNRQKKDLSEKRFALEGPPGRGDEARKTTK